MFEHNTMWQCGTRNGGSRPRFFLAISAPQLPRNAELYGISLANKIDRKSGDIWQDWQQSPSQGSRLASLLGKRMRVAVLE